MRQIASSGTCESESDLFEALRSLANCLRFVNSAAYALSSTAKLRPSGGSHKTSNFGRLIRFLQSFADKLHYRSIGNVLFFLAFVSPGCSRLLRLASLPLQKRWPKETFRLLIPPNLANGETSRHFSRSPCRTSMRSNEQVYENSR